MTVKSWRRLGNLPTTCEKRRGSFGDCDNALVIVVSKSERKVRYVYFAFGNDLFK